MTKLIDPESYALAQHFLSHEGADAQTTSLAEAIQTAVEDWFTAEQIAQGDGPSDRRPFSTRDGNAGGGGI